MTKGEDRREQIADASIRIVAGEGVRALTHRAVDRRLDLPAGSTSFYARSRRSLLHLAAAELAARSRGEFAGSGLRDPASSSVDLGAVAAGIARFVDDLLTRHHDDIVARYALALEVRRDEELRDLLAAATFSATAAEGLMCALDVADPASAADDLVSLLEGLLLDHVLGRRGSSPASARRVALQRAVHHFLDGLPRAPRRT